MAKIGDYIDPRNLEPHESEDEPLCPKCNSHLTYHESPSMVGYDYDWSMNCSNPNCGYYETGHPDIS